MPNLRLRLPPANSLIAFEASARHVSFTRAAEELTISREAVSRHIRILEDHLGVKLFKRLHRAIELTPDGTAFFKVVQKALGDIAKSADGLRGTDGRTRVVVTATVAIASFWLTPRLPRFRKAYPDMEMRVAVSDTPVNALSDEFDVALRYGAGEWPGFDSVHLFDVQSHPVCSPGYLDDNGPISTPADLAGHTLLNLDGATHAGEDWSWFFSGHGVTPPRTLRILGFDNYANVIQAALDGQGVAIGFGGILDDLFRKGTLVRALDTPLSRGLGVHAVTRSGTRLKGPARLFHEWVVEEANTHSGL